MEIRLVTAAETRPLRHKVLRPNQPISMCEYPDDEHPNSFHLAYFLDGEIVSIASYYNHDEPKVEAKNPYRLRGMATEPKHRGKGYGAALVHKSLEILKERNADVLWCNARTTACGYYKKLNFSKVGDEFAIEGIGPHYVMQLAL